MDTEARELSQFSPEERRRIQLTTRVRITDSIPKVPDAGEVQTRNGVEVQVMHNGVLVEKDCYYGSWTTEIIKRLRGHHEPQEEIAFYELIDALRADTPEPTMVELGAYWAYYSLWFKSAFPAAGVVLVEPDLHNLQVGLRNFEFNGFSARSMQGAVGPKHSGTVRLRYDSDGEVHSVPSVTVDGLMADMRLPRVDLVLCDVQGAEIYLLPGALDAIRCGRLRFVVISTHWFRDKPLIHQMCCTLVQRFGGHIIADHTITESCSGDGLIVASFDPRDSETTIDLPVVRARDSFHGELEWRLARRVGWRGLLSGAADLMPAQMREAAYSLAGGLGLMSRLRAFRS